MFPPASLSLESAVEEYRAVRAGGDAWLVDRFICPADRLVDLARVLLTTMRRGEAPWSLVVTATPDDRRTVADFSAEMGRAARIETVEMKLPAGATVSGVADLLADFDRVIFFEVPWQGPFEDHLEMLATARESSGRSLGAKLRCGGTVADAFPPVGTVAAFLVACARLRLSVKATAGLHHPVRHVDPATGFTHHGFLNLLAATALAHGGAEASELAAALGETDAAEFVLGPQGLACGDHRFGAEALAALRRDLFVGYGSCSIAEPVEDLTALGILPVTS
jgi:hypothetical protein